MYNLRTHVHDLTVLLEMFEPGFKRDGRVQQKSGGTFYFRKHGVVYVLFDRCNKFPWLRVWGNGWHGRYRMTGAITLVDSEEYGTNYICEETTMTKGINIIDV